MFQKNSSRTLFSHIFSLTLLVVVMATLFILFFSSKNYREYFIEEEFTSLRNQAELYRELVTDNLIKRRLKPINTEAVRLGKHLGIYFSVIDTEGEVLADSHMVIEGLENQALKPEVYQALKGSFGETNRYSFVFKKDFLFVALPVLSKGEIVGVVRASKPMSKLVAGLNKVRSINLISLVVALFAAGLLIFFRIRRLVLPARELESYAQKVAAGEQSRAFHAQLDGAKEFKEITSSLLTIIDKFGHTESKISQSQVQQAAILSNMNEGVVAVGGDGRILHVNHSAAEILNINNEVVNGKTAPEVIRQPVLQRFITKSCYNREKAEKEIIIDSGTASEKIFIVRASPFGEEENGFFGVLFVLMDVTKLRQLEKHRQAFVSNVSHELKTPLTAIKGYAETMQNPSIDSVENLKQCASIVLRHADQLDALIDDLLTLSRLENEADPDSIEMIETKISHIIRSALEYCEEKAKRKKINVNIQNELKDAVLGNSNLLTQALVNLLDNAIKYSPEGTEVTLDSRELEEFFVITVKDQGRGIPEKSIPRLFERFYRVDKGRSREMGGTGLGLSIVKHILNVHRGEVEVESVLGEGSVFSLKIPKPKEVGS